MYRLYSRLSVECLTIQPRSRHKIRVAESLFTFHSTLAPGIIPLRVTHALAPRSSESTCTRAACTLACFPESSIPSPAFLFHAPHNIRQEVLPGNEKRKSFSRSRFAWNETAGTRHLRDANMDISPNMVLSCQVTRQTPPFCCAQGRVQGTRAGSYVHSVGHSPRASTELHGTRRKFRASVMLWRFYFHFFDLLFLSPNSFYTIIKPYFPPNKNGNFNEF